MPAIKYKKKTYAGATFPVLELTKAEYDALTDAKKMDGTVYMITDDDGGWEAERSTYDNTASGLTATNVQSALDEISSNKHKIPVPQVISHYGCQILDGYVLGTSNAGGIIVRIPFPVKAFHYTADGENQVGICNTSASLPTVITQGTNRVRFANKSAGECIYDDLRGYPYNEEYLFLGRSGSSGDVRFTDMWFESYEG